MTNIFVILLDLSKKFSCKNYNTLISKFLKYILDTFYLIFNIYLTIQPVGSLVLTLFNILVTVLQFRVFAMNSL